MKNILQVWTKPVIVTPVTAATVFNVRSAIPRWRHNLGTTSLPVGNRLFPSALCFLTFYVTFVCMIRHRNDSLCLNNRRRKLGRRFSVVIYTSIFLLEGFPCNVTPYRQLLLCINNKRLQKNKAREEWTITDQMQTDRQTVAQPHTRLSPVLFIFNFFKETCVRKLCAIKKTFIVNVIKNKKNCKAYLVINKTRWRILYKNKCINKCINMFIC